MTLGLDFHVTNKHFKRGDMKLKCLATIATIYLQSNEESVEGDESVSKTPLIESRESRAQSHTREDLTNGKFRKGSYSVFSIYSRNTRKQLILDLLRNAKYSF